MKMGMDMQMPMMEPCPMQMPMMDCGMDSYGT